MKMQIIKRRNIWFTLSGILVGGSILALSVFNLNFGIDFTGGTLLEIETPSSISSVQDLNKILIEFADINSVKVQSSGENRYLARFNYIENDVRNRLNQYLEEKIPNYEELRYETIGPIIGADLKEKAIIALGLAIIFIVLYIAFAFRKIPQSMSSWKFGVTAVIALVHDVLITVGVFSVLGYYLNVEIDSLFVTALLTIMGWSVNDTIVVFDRLRENIIKDRRRPFAESAEISIDETVSRSINTSMTTLLTLAALFFLAGTSIKFFVLALIVGIIIGTYSSIFLATPLLVVWNSSNSYLIHRKEKVDSFEAKTEIENTITNISKKKKLKRKKR
jgi:preprotein translocase subunit SecF